MNTATTHKSLQALTISKNKFTSVINGSGAQQLELRLRHKSLRLQALQAENQVMRQNISKLLRDIDVLEQIVARL